jgi:hypothetical protein
MIGVRWKPARRRRPVQNPPQFSIPQPAAIRAIIPLPPRSPNLWTLPNAENRIRIAAAGDACLRAFGIVTALRQGALMDEVEIDNALSELPRPPPAGGRDGSEITVVRVTRICLRSAKY